MSPVQRNSPEPPTMTDSAHLLGIEIGGTKLQVALGRPDGSLAGIERRPIDPKRGAAGILEQIPGMASDLRRRLGVDPAGLQAVGVGFGGPVDSKRGRPIESHQVDGWEDYPLADWARSTLGAPRVAVENDAATAALGEARFGAGVGHDPVLYVTIGSGVGGGLIVGGSIYRGSGRGAVEIGHLFAGPTRTNTLGIPVPTVEGLAAGWSIAARGREAARFSDGPLARLAGGDPDRVTAELVARAAGTGDPEAGRILDSARWALGEALAHAITLLAPSVIILGGGVSLIGEEHWFAPIRRIVDARVFPAFRGSYTIVPAALGEAVVLHGALALAADLARAGD